ncbi:MAG: GDSL-type esterase/lipase family protein [Bacillota bacterium]|nr:GDSL-type esterase/lipase family protein [Bacillota bacterium]
MGKRDASDLIKRVRFKPRFVFFVLFMLIFIMVFISRCTADNRDTADEKQPGEIIENTDGSGDVQGNADVSENDGTNAQVDNTEKGVYGVFEGALFIGDSRTEGLKLYSGIDNADFFCAKSMTIDKVVDGKKVNVDGQNLSVYDMLSSKQYSKVYICLGINELGWVSIDKFLTEYEELISKIKSAQPGADIYVELLFPVGENRSNSDKTVNNAQIYWYNTNLVELAERNNVKYLNPDKPLINENGALKEEATSDGVHINREYCRIWAEYLAQITY